RGAPRSLRAKPLQIEDELRRGLCGSRGEDDPKPAPIDDAILDVLIVNLGDDMTAGGQPERHAVRQLRVSVPRRPATEPLPGLLDAERRRTYDAAIAW